MQKQKKYIESIDIEIGDSNGNHKAKRNPIEISIPSHKNIQKKQILIEFDSNEQDDSLNIFVSQNTLKKQENKETKNKKAQEINIQVEEKKDKKQQFQKNKFKDINILVNDAQKVKNKEINIQIDDHKKTDKQQVNELNIIVFDNKKQNETLQSTNNIKLNNQQQQQPTNKTQQAKKSEEIEIIIGDNNKSTKQTDKQNTQNINSYQQKMKYDTQNQQSKQQDGIELFVEEKQEKTKQIAEIKQFKEQIIQNNVQKQPLTEYKKIQNNQFTQNQKTFSQPLQVNNTISSNDLFNKQPFGYYDKLHVKDEQQIKNWKQSFKQQVVSNIRILVDLDKIKFQQNPIYKKEIFLQISTLIKVIFQENNLQRIVQTIQQDTTEINLILELVNHKLIYKFFDKMFFQSENISEYSSFMFAQIMNVIFVYQFNADVIQKAIIYLFESGNCNLIFMLFECQIYANFDKSLQQQNKPQNTQTLITQDQYQVLQDKTKLFMEKISNQLLIDITKELDNQGDISNIVLSDKPLKQIADLYNLDYQQIFVNDKTYLFIIEKVIKFVITQYFNINKLEGQQHKQDVEAFLINMLRNGAILTEILVINKNQLCYKYKQYRLQNNSLKNVEYFDYLINLLNGFKNGLGQLFKKKKQFVEILLQQIQIAESNIRLFLQDFSEFLSSSDFILKNKIQGFYEIQQIPIIYSYRLLSKNISVNDLLQLQTNILFDQLSNDEIDVIQYYEQHKEYQMKYLYSDQQNLNSSNDSIKIQKFTSTQLIQLCMLYNKLNIISDNQQKLIDYISPHLRTQEPDSLMYLTIDTVFKSTKINIKYCNDQSIKFMFTQLIKLINNYYSSYISFLRIIFRYQQVGYNNFNIYYLKQALNEFIVSEIQQYILQQQITIQDIEIHNYIERKNLQKIMENESAFLIIERIFKKHNKQSNFDFAGLCKMVCQHNEVAKILNTVK